MDGCVRARPVVDNRQSRWGRRLHQCFAAAVIVLAGCNEKEPPPVPVASSVSVNDSPRSVPTIFSRQDSILLQETGQHVVVGPIQAFDQDSNLVIVDPKERRIAAYARSGRLVWEYARRGRGPGELELPVAAALTAEGLWIADVFNGVFLVDRSTGKELRKLPVGSNATQGLLALSDTSLLLVGRRAAVDGRTSQLHAIDARTGQSLWNALEVTEELLPSGSAKSFGFTAARVSRGRVTATYSLLDTVYQFDLNGRVVLRQSLPITRVEPLVDGTGRKPSVEQVRNLVRVVGAYELNDSTLAVASQRGSAREAVYGIAIIHRGADGIVQQSVNTPLLIGYAGSEIIASYVNPMRPNLLLMLSITGRDP